MEACDFWEKGLVKPKNRTQILENGKKRINFWNRTSQFVKIKLRRPEVIKRWTFFYYRFLWKQKNKMDFIEKDRKKGEIFFTHCFRLDRPLSRLFKKNFFGKIFVFVCFQKQTKYEEKKTRKRRDRDKQWDIQRWCWCWVMTIKNKQVDYKRWFFKELIFFQQKFFKGERIKQRKVIFWNGGLGLFNHH